MTFARKRFHDDHVTGLKPEGKLGWDEASLQCGFGEGWVYFEGYCYLFSSYHIESLKTDEKCKGNEARLANCAARGRERN